MKAMLISDLLIARKYLLQQIAITLFVGLFVAIGTERLYVVPPAVGVMIPFSLAFTLVSLDERNDWQQFRLALPIPRSSIVRGRYASLLCLTLVGTLVGLAEAGIIGIVALLLPGVPQISGLMVDFSWQALLLVSIAGTGVLLVMLSIVMPGVTKFGMTKAVRFAPLLVVLFLFVFIGITEGSDIMPAFVGDFLSWMSSTEGTLAAAGIVLIVALALFALSSVLSVKLYENREF